MHRELNLGAGYGFAELPASQLQLVLLLLLLDHLGTPEAANLCDLPEMATAAAATALGQRASRSSRSSGADVCLTHMFVCASSGQCLLACNARTHRSPYTYTPVPV